MNKLLALCIVCWGIFFYQTAKANDYETATGAHIITETIKGTDIDYQSLLSTETQKIIHQKQNLLIHYLNIYGQFQ